MLILHSASTILVVILIVSCKFIVAVIILSAVLKDFLTGQAEVISVYEQDFSQVLSAVPLL